MMQLPFFFERDLPADFHDFELSAETSNHVTRVLRMQQGDLLILTDGKGTECEVNIVKPDRKKTLVELHNRRTVVSPTNRNGIGISLLKNESRFEWFLEKATELGLRNIYPLIASRTEKTSFRKDRMERIMISAMLQSRQLFLPVLYEPVGLEELFLLSTDYQQKFIAHCAEGEKGNIRQVVAEELTALVLIGPEGDFTDDEISTCLNEGFLPVSLGDTRLRTETAGIVSAVHLSN